MAPRNKVNPDKNFHKRTKTNWKGNDRTNPNSDPFFAKKSQKSENKESEISDRKNTVDRSKKFTRSNHDNPDKPQGLFKKSSKFDDKSGKIDKNKKTFDKKKWRLQKYSKKYKLEQWEEKRKKAVLRGYYREIKDEPSKIDVQKIYETYDSDNETQNKRRNYVQHPDFVWTEDNSDENKEQSIENKQKNDHTKKTFTGRPKNIAYKKAQSEFQRIQEEKKAKKEEIMQKKAEREKALLEYKQKKKEKYKKLNQKTRKGQPIMRGRIEMLLEKIQSN